MKIEKEHKAELVRRVQIHMEQEHDLDLGDLGAALLLDFFGELVGPVYYNEAIDDARAVALNRSDTIQEELLGLTRKVKSRDG